MNVRLEHTLATFIFSHICIQDIFFMRISILSFLFLLALSCQQGASGRIVFKNNLGDYDSRVMHFGESLNITADESAHDSLVLYLNEKRIRRNFELNESSAKYGTNSLRLVAFSDGEEMQRRARFKVLPTEAPKVVNLTILKTYPHNQGNFTEGFEYEAGLVYEGTGLKGSSKIDIYDLATGEVKLSKKLEDRLFGEGITKQGDKLYQLTYKAQKAFVYDAQTLDRVGEHTYTFSREGWGLCTDGEYLIMSNGSPILFFIDPETFTLHHYVEAVDHEGLRSNLNELEYRDGKVYANVWYENTLLEIDAGTGVVRQVLLFPPLPFVANRDEVANGISFKDGNYLITGKNWPSIFEMNITDTENPIN